MAEVRNEEEERALPAKGKRHPTCEVEEKEVNDPNKKQKVDSSVENDSSVAQGKQIDTIEEEEEVDGDDENDEEDYEDGEEDSEDDDEHSNGEAEIDGKGKGIVKEGKGKEKLIEESDDSSDDDDVIESEGESDLSDDPLEEVDLDNILPSRTRQRTVRPGVFIADDREKDVDDDDSDDSDA